MVGRLGERESEPQRLAARVPLDDGAARDGERGERVVVRDLPQTLTIRDTGAGWQVVPSPNVGAASINFFNDISALSATNAWAVGERETSSFVRRTLIAHFTNGSWKVVASPNSGTGHNRLLGVDTPSGTNVWTVGTASHPIGSNGLIEHSC